MSWTTRLPGKVARSLIAWAERSADPAEREWVQALRAELNLIDEGLAQLRWATGVMPLLWRSYRADILRWIVCITAVVVANYAYPKVPTVCQVFFGAQVVQVFFANSDGNWTPLDCGKIELFFFAQQLYLPVVGILVAQATRRVLAGTLIGMGLSLLGFALLHGLLEGSLIAKTVLATGVASSYMQILFFALVGAALGTLGASAGLRISTRAIRLF
jgi:hypothetical protein